MIQAKIIADSKSPQGHRLTTLEVIMPRYILSEFNTHRVLSKNSASSRAIPFEKMVKSVEDNPFIPYAWQVDHKGMQGTEYLENPYLIEEATRLWLKARDNAIISATLLNGSVGGEAITKQLCNRLLEPFMYHKVLVSGTEWENFFNLRCPQYSILNEVYKSKKEILNIFKNTDLYKEHSILDWLNINKGQADIHMMFLAEAIYDAINESIPKELKEGEWHIPYGEEFNKQELQKIVGTKDNDINHENMLPTILKISVARCARLSYQTLGDNPVIDYEKDLQLYDILSKSGHWSPFEHVAKVMTNDEYHSWCKGKIKVDTVEAITIDNLGWCRNFKGFIQYRELID